MTQILSAFDNPTADFSVIQGLSGNGQAVAGASYPQGIPGVLTIENGIMRAFCSDDHATTSGGHRTEIYLPADTFTAESWVTWSFMLPSAYWADFTGIITIAQFHDTPDSGDPARQPSFMLQFNNRNLQTTWPSAVLPMEVSASRQVSGLTLELDRWYSMCARFKWSITTTGFREIFCDRVPIYREWNVPTNYDDVVGPYFKLGMYFTNNGNSCGQKVLYARNLERWTGNDGYQAVMGGVPVIAARMQQL